MAAIKDAEPAQAQTADGNSSETRRTTPVCLVLGMAGSGKTTLVDALSAFIEDPCSEEDSEEDDDDDDDGDDDDDDDDDGDDDDDDDDDGDDDDEHNVIDRIQKLKIKEEAEKTNNGDSSLATSTERPAVDVLDADTEAFVMNLDPAVFELPYEANIDIRDTIDYKKVMSDYKLGPNGAIITSLNLYATRFDQVMKILDGHSEPEKRITIIDTPGQIETFTWSASGTIITDALAHSFPTVVLYVIDSVRAKNVMTFISNMLYACSIMYKTKLPMVVVFNKTDVEDAGYAETWMRDFDEFDKHINDSIFIGDLARSMAMTLNSFYDSMRTVQVSAATGKGLAKLIANIKEAAREYDTEYKPLLEQRIKQKALEEKEKQKQDLERFKHDSKDDIAHSPEFAAGLRNRTVDNSEELDPALRPSRFRDDDDDEDDVDPAPKLTSEQKKRLQKMMHDGPAGKSLGVAGSAAPAEEEQEEIDEEERQAYQEYRKYVEAIRGKKL